MKDQTTRDSKVPARAATIATAEKAVRDRPEDPEAHLNLGLAFVLNGESERGLACFETAARLEPRSAVIRYHIGICHREAGRLLKAAESFADAICFDGNLHAAWIGLAGVKASLGDFPGARQAAQAAARLCPGEKNPLRMLILIELLDGNFPAIDGPLEAYRAKGGDPSTLFFELPTLCGEGRAVDVAGAVRSRRATLAREAAVFLGDYFTERHLADAAIACLLDARSLGPDDAMTMTLLSRAYSFGCRPIEAEAAARLATALDPENVDAWLQRGRLLRTIGKDGEAVEAYRTATHIEPANGIAWYNLGLTLVGNGQIEEAITAYREAARLGPESSRALNNMGWLLWSTDRENEARTAFEASIRQNPGNGRAWGNLGHLLRQQCHVEGAIYCLREAVRLRPDRTDLAIELLELESDPTPPAT